MQFNKLVSENVIHFLNFTCMCPVRVMYCCKRDISKVMVKIPFVALLCCIKHMSRIETMNKIWWKGGFLFVFVNG
jgi:hypothetical protein